MIILPKNAIIVERDFTKENPLKLVLDYTPIKPNSGTILFTHESLNHLQLSKVIFRENFIEEIQIEGKTLVYIRDFDSSIYYVTTD
jgi:hypothetical protein